MTSTSHASRKRVEDAEIFQVLEDSTDSDVTIFSSEEDKECKSLCFVCREKEKISIRKG
jgi:hypothetical protein